MLMNIELCLCFIVLKIVAFKVGFIPFNRKYFIIKIGDIFYPCSWDILH